MMVDVADILVWPIDLDEGEPGVQGENGRLPFTALHYLGLYCNVDVSDDEWAKYNLMAPAGRPVDRLIRELSLTADALGISSVDTTPALQGAQPGAFLPTDWHMTANGHDAVAAAIETVLLQEPPRGRPEMSPPPAWLPPAL